MPSMNTKDAKLIESLGGSAKVASLMNLEKPNGTIRVNNWKKRGIPARVKLEFPNLFLKKEKS